MLRFIIFTIIFFILLISEPYAEFYIFTGESLNQADTLKIDTNYQQKIFPNFSNKVQLTSMFCQQCPHLDLEEIIDIAYMTKKITVSNNYTVDNNKIEDFEIGYKFMDSATSNSYNSIFGSNISFAPEVGKELFTSTNTSLSANNSLSFINFLYELPIDKELTIFSGVGLGYGMASIGDNEFIAKQSITYSAYQYKAGAYYSLNKNLDITLNYTNFNLIGSAKNTSSRSSLTVKDTRFHSINIGLKYNIFRKNPTFAESYNYKKFLFVP
ncbi:MAG: outer membrane beta-barrel protein [Alphaproteobacteria bacterium]|jgi:opacity protein-like surface antigen|nr:outer membrane beta-barrel protein [Alphaproteobacteria bacterium]